MLRAIILTVATLLACLVLSDTSAQTPLAGAVPHPDPFNPGYVAGELLVCFHEDIKPALKQGGLAVTTGMDSLDRLLLHYRFTACKPLSQAAGLAARTDAMNPGSGGVPIRPDRIWRLFSNDTVNMEEAAQALGRDRSVRFAEPNYRVYAFAAQPTGKYHPDGVGDHRALTPNDALFQSGNQWYLNEIQAPQAWDSVTGDTAQVIGIIDTGIDLDHPDLDGNLWHNYGEIPANGIDDDQNGYADDTRGWDFINNDAVPDDDNGHGTHVAGVAAAETDNYLGMAGVAWNARLMPLKVLSGTGQGNIADLAEAILYAAVNGASVINMSLGYYNESQTVKAALLFASVTLFPVAAAGNDHYKTDTVSTPPDPYAPGFPACYPFVAGVEASTPAGTLAGFSNFDPSGFRATANPSGYNYEIRAPGVNIMSAFPGGGYASLNGTSMAAPIVSGAVALLKTFRPGITNPEIFARLVQFSQNSILRIPNLLSASLQPDLLCEGHTLVDTTAGADRDGVADAGETIDLWLSVKNAGGFADSAWARLSLAFPADTSLILITDSLEYIGNLDTASYTGSIPAYTTLTGQRDPFRLTVKPGVANDREIILRYRLGARNAFTRTGTMVLTIQDARELFGVLDSSLTIGPGKLWLVQRSFKVAATGILNLLPGTRLSIRKEIVNTGVISAHGTPDSLIVIEGNIGINCWGWTGTVHFSHTRFNADAGALFSGASGASTFDHCIFENFGNVFTGCGFNLTDCIFRNGGNVASWGGGNVVRCIFDNCQGYFGHGGYSFVNNNFSGRTGIFTDPTGVAFGRNNFAPGPGMLVYKTVGYEYDYVPNQYWGTTDPAVIDRLIYDFWDNPNLAQVIYTPLLTQPTDSAHGFIWKVLVNNQDPQQGPVDPVGCERVRFDVYFNKAMDTACTPRLSFGVRFPFTQRIALTDPSWSPDSSVWTVYHDVDIGTGDGLNAIRVSGACDTAGFTVATENTERFAFTIQAASSLATAFSAIPGIGKVYLEWPYEYTSDFLGFNMYRFVRLSDTLNSDTLVLNQNLITDSAYTDYQVNPDSVYGYLYRIVGTDLREKDFSECVTAQPLATANGDANGDHHTDVLDITAMVAFILGQQPKPFLFEAADLNSDASVDILDVVLLINLIMGDGNGSGAAAAGCPGEPPGIMTAGGPLVSLSSAGHITALQFSFSFAGDGPGQMAIEPLDEDHELITGVSGNSIRGVLFSFRNVPFGGGVQSLFRLTGEKSPGGLKAFGAGACGQYIPVLTGHETVPPPAQSSATAWPNPFAGPVLFRIPAPAPGHMTLRVYDRQGRMVFSSGNVGLNEGMNEYRWNGLDTGGSPLPEGLYFCDLRIETSGYPLMRRVFKLMHLNTPAR